MTLNTWADNPNWFGIYVPNPNAKHTSLNLYKYMDYPKRKRIRMLDSLKHLNKTIFTQLHDWSEKEDKKTHWKFQFSMRIENKFHTFIIYCNLYIVVQKKRKEKKISSAAKYDFFLYNF